jgi:predicted ATPase
MYLVNLELKNFRAIRHMAIDFHESASPEARRWTVFLGENGCGKSSILKAIGLILAGSEALPDLLGEPDQWIHVGESQAEITAVVQTQNYEPRTIQLVLTRGDRRDSVLRNNSQRLELLDAAIEKADRNYFIAGYGAFRRPPDPRRSVSSSVERGRAAQLATLFSSAQDLINIEQWAMDVDYSTAGSGRDLISETLARLLPGMKFHDIDKVNRSVIMDTVDGLVPLRQLSEGYQAMAAWAGDLLYRMTQTFRDWTKPLEARGVLLLDEMDLHLHPVWKRNLVDFMDSAFPHLQIISTTHSPLSVQQCREGELFVVKREPAGPMLFPFQGDPSKMRLSDLFLSPLIGLDTLDSPRVASLRMEARDIELKPGRMSESDTKALAAIGEALEGTDPLPGSEAPSLKPILQFQRRLESVESPALLIRMNERLFGSSAPTKSAKASSKAPPKGKSVADSSIAVPKSSSTSRKLKKPQVVTRAAAKK